MLGYKFECFLYKTSARAMRVDAICPATRIPTIRGPQNRPQISISLFDIGRVFDPLQEDLEIIWGL